MNTDELPPDYVPNRHGAPGTTEIVLDDDSDDDDDTWTETSSEYTSDDSDDDTYDTSYSRTYRNRFLGMELRVKFTPYQLTYVFIAVATAYCLNAIVWTLF